MTSPSSKSPNLTKATQDFIKFLASQDYAPLYSLTPEKARKFLDDLQKKTHKEIEADVTDTSIFTSTAGNVEITIVRPKDNNEKLPVILYAHGGGWILGDKDVFDMLIRKLANCTQSVVVFVNFTPAPEAIYPLISNQIYATLEYLFENPDEFNIDSNRIAIVGDSAGGNLATVTALRAKKENGPKILYQVLLYPVTDASMSSQSYKDFQNGPWLTKKAMEWFWDAYLPDKKRREDPYVSPLNATLEDLAGMPDTLVITDENDVLRDEGEAYAAKLDKAGVKTLNIRINGTIHDFLMLNALADTKPAKDTLTLVCELLKKALHQ